MAASLVQSVTGDGPTLTLNGVAAGNCLVLEVAYYRSGTTGLAEAVPTDTNGTFAAGRTQVPNIQSLQDVGASGFFEKNCASGTHTVTPEANSALRAVLSEWSGLDTASPLITGNSGNGSGAGTSQATGASASASSGDVAFIQYVMGSAVGVADVGFTDPVANYTTLRKVVNSQTDLPAFEAYRILSANGTENATFNWTTTDSTDWWQASIFVLKAAATAADQPPVFLQDPEEDDDTVQPEIFAIIFPPDQVFCEDGSMQPVEPEEQHEVQGFDIAPLSPNFPAQTDQLISYYPDQAEEPDEEWLWPDYWAQAPPESPAVTTIEIEDGSLQPFDEDEFLEGFSLNPTPPSVTDQIPVEDAGNQLEDEELLEGFADAPFPAAAVVDQISVEDAALQLEDEELQEGFSDSPSPVEIEGPLTSEDSDSQLDEDEFLEPDQASPAPVETDGPLTSDDASGQQEEDEFAEGFVDAPRAAEIEGPLTSENSDLSQPDEDEFLEGLSADPVPDDVLDLTPIYCEDASQQPDELDDADLQDFNSAPLPDDAIVDADYVQPYDDASAQPDELDDADSQDFMVSPLPDDAAPDVVPPLELGARWPIEVKVYRRIKKLERDEEKVLRAKAEGKPVQIPAKIALDEPRVAAAVARALASLPPKVELEYGDLVAIRAKLAQQQDEDWLLLY